MLQGEHSAILSAFIKLPIVIKIFVLSIFEWVFYTGFTVYNLYIKISPSFENRERSAWALVGIDAFLLLLYNSLWFNFKCTCISCHILSKLHARHLSRDMWFPTMWRFDKCRLRPPFAASFQAKKLQIMFGQRLANALIRLHVCMCKLIWAFAGHTFHIVGSLMSRLICFYTN